jgi:predicted metalloendopeptidase
LAQPAIFSVFLIKTNKDHAVKRLLPRTLALSLLLGFGMVHAQNTTGPVSGIETQYIDPQVRAQDDFFRYLNGKWLATVEIPADKSSWGAFNKVIDDIQPQLKALIENAAKNPGAGSDNQKIGDLYNSFMDEAKLEQLGLTPLADELAKVKNLTGKQQIPALLGHFARIGVSAPYEFTIHQDAKDATKYVADLGQSGLGMPDRDYYLKQDDKRLAETRAKYWQHIANMFELAGHKDSGQIASQILALETELARAQWTRVETRDPVKAYNKFPISKLAALAPGYDWPAYLKQAGLAGKTDYLIISQPSYIKGMAKVLQQQPLAAWKLYLEWQILRNYAPNLSQAFVKENFAFYGTTLSGALENRPRWKRAVSLVEGSLGESVGKLYVAQYFPLEHKAKMEALVKNLLLAYKQSIDTLDWMSPATKKEAQDKLAKFTPKIGYPNRWKDYSKLVIKGDDLVGNILRTTAHGYERELNKLGKPVDRDEWFISPQTVNAYYNPELNEIVFPAAILQPPFFDAKADDAVNYGAIGAVIGHEISHGFDDSGSQYDGNGNLRNWWTPQDDTNFKAKTKLLIEQYGNYSPVPGYKVNGELTLGENIADNSGLAIAWKAYQLSQGGKPAAEIDGLSGSQRFFMGFGQVWRAKMREQAAIARIKTDPHSPAEFRANGTLRNHPGFYEAFKLKEGDKMYLAPEKRVTIW